jgi:hypothetical protein
MPKKKAKGAKKAAAAALTAAASEGAIKNCVWSNNNAACVNTWFCLSKDLMGQLGVAFDDAPTVKVSELAFWNSLSPGTREVEAQSIADMLTKLFTNMIGAAYEPGQNYASAVIALTSVLTNGDKTICELAAVVDEQHRFLIGEA